MKLEKQNCLALLIDVQERLFPHIYKHTKLLKNITIALQGLQLFEIPIIVTEQYPRGLGSTISSLESLINGYPKFEKTTFSCARDKTFLEYLQQQPQKTLLLMGIEAHVCVLQTALDCKLMGYEVFVIWDCVSSRKKSDKNISRLRLLNNGIQITSYESLLFELCEDSALAPFKALSNLVK
ncbi:MAG: isochorismatase family protein [Bacteroidia bacterium]|nr:isochorismatase family protein [Bacteroidia bacterium]MDW8159570.1 isochorismatase family protein [Bacteroidia bacterium]